MKMTDNIFISYEKNDFKKLLPIKKITDWTIKIMKELKLNNKHSISIFFVSNKYINILNKKYLLKDCPTDVLSFSQIEGENPLHSLPEFIGDIVIAVPYVLNNADILNKLLIDEIYYLILHGLLHIIGYNHENVDNEKSEMLKFQNKLYRKLKGVKIGKK